MTTAFESSACITWSVLGRALVDAIISHILAELLLWPQCIEADNMFIPRDRKWISNDRCRCPLQMLHTDLEVRIGEENHGYFGT